MDGDRNKIMANANRVAARLKLMGHPERLMMLCRMAEGEVSAGELVTLSGLSQSAASQHLALMRDEGIVSTEARRQSRVYRLTDPTVRAVINALCEVCAENGETV